MLLAKVGVDFDTERLYVEHVAEEVSLLSLYRNAFVREHIAGV